MTTPLVWLRLRGTGVRGGGGAEAVAVFEGGTGVDPNAPLWAGVVSIPDDTDDPRRRVARLLRLVAEELDPGASAPAVAPRCSCGPYDAGCPHRWSDEADDL